MPPRKKERIDLTIERKFKKIARELADKRLRSISGLIEDLLEEEQERVNRQETTIGFHIPKGFPEGDCKSCRHFINAIDVSRLS